MSCLVDSMAIKKNLQLQVLKAVSICAKSIAAADLPRGTQIIPETIRVQRHPHDTHILYNCAIALKLAHLWQLHAIDIANQLVTTLGEKFYCPAGEIYLTFSIEVVSSGWIYFRLKEESLATWLQNLISPRDEEMEGWGDREMEKTITGSDNFFPLQYTHARCCSLLRLAHQQGLIKLNGMDCTNSNSGLDTSTSSSPENNQQKIHRYTEKEQTQSNSQFSIFNFPNPIPWLNEAQGLDRELLQLRLVHPAERRLIAQIIDVQDALTNQNQLQGIKLARDLSQAFEHFYRSCHIWGEVKSQTPKLAQARLGLVAVTQILLRSLLQEKLCVLAPVEL